MAEGIIDLLISEYNAAKPNKKSSRITPLCLSLEEG